MKYILAFTFTLLAFSHVTYAIDVVENGKILFKLESVAPIAVTGTTAMLQANLRTISLNAIQPTRKGFYYGLKSVPDNSFTFIDSQSTFTSVQRIFGARIPASGNLNLTCGTDYSFIPYFEYVILSEKKPIYGDKLDFKTASCDESNKLNIIEFKVTNFKKDSVDIVLRASNATLYRSVTTLEFRKGTTGDFTVAPEQLAIEKNSSGQIIFLLKNLLPDTSYTYRIKTQFVLPPTGPNSGPNIVSSSTSLQDTFRTLKVDGTGGSTGGLEDITTAFTIRTADFPTPTTRNALLSASIETTNSYGATKIQTWFRFREKGKTTWEISALSGQEITVRGRDFNHTFTARSATGVSCALYGSDAVNVGKILETDAVIGTLALVKINNIEYEFQGMGQYLSKLKANPAYSCAPPTPSTSGGGGSNTNTGNDTYTLITPLPLGENNNELITDVQIGDGSIIDLINRIFTLMLVVAIVLAVVFMIIGGARYATGDSLGSIGGGKEIITNAVKGLLFALLAWLLLNIINPDLLRFSLELEKKGGATGSSTPYSAGGSILTGDGCGAGVSDEECFQRIIADEPRVRALFTAENIAINADTCPKFGSRGCTTVGLLNPTTLQNIIRLKKECVVEKPDCKVMITGGTEYWLHGSGGNHKRFTAVDLRISGDAGTNAFSSFVRSKQKIGTLTFCNETFTHANLRLCDEKGGIPHWHVDTVTGGGSGVQSGNLIRFENIGVNNAGVWGKASGQPITNSQVQALINSAKTQSWYPTVRQIAGSDAKILTAIIMVESSGDTNATRTEPDGRKSCGLGQVLTDTAKILEPNTFGMLSVEAICTELKKPDVGIRLAHTFYKSFRGDFKIRVASYNGGPGRSGPGGPSTDCPGLTRFECPWDSGGCYDQTKPNDKPTKTDCAVNDGYEVTRFYINKVKKISDGL